MSHVACAIVADGVAQCRNVATCFEAIGTPAENAERHSVAGMQPNHLRENSDANGAADRGGVLIF